MRIPKLRKGSYFPGFLEPRRIAEKALTAVAETFWTAFLRKLARRGLRGVKLAISDAHEGIKGAVAKVLNASYKVQAWIGGHIALVRNQ